MIKILKYGEVDNKDIFARQVPTANVSDAVSDIIKEVRQRGDAALLDLTEKFDKVRLEALEVSSEEIEEAYSEVDEKFKQILIKAAENIRKFHQKQVRNSFIINDENGIVVGQKVTAVDRAGLYVPGGTAAYPSTVLMDAIPAKIAGVEQVVMVTPPGKDGKIPDVILAAARICSSLRYRMRLISCRTDSAIPYA